MIRLGLVRLVSYREWTRSLHEDREHVIQSVQARIFGTLVEESSNIDAFALPLTYDSYVVILNAVSVEDYWMMIGRLNGAIPMGIRGYVGVGRTYQEAMRNAIAIQPRSESPYEACGKTAVIHADVNGYCKLIDEYGVLSAWRLVMDLFARARGIVEGYGGLAYYAGGDNILCFIPMDNVGPCISDLASGIIKLGVGIGNTPRNALRLATKALESARSMGNAKPPVMVLDDDN